MTLTNNILGVLEWIVVTQQHVQLIRIWSKKNSSWFRTSMTAHRELHEVVQKQIAQLTVIRQLKHFAVSEEPMRTVTGGRKNKLWKLLPTLRRTSIPGSGCGAWTRMPGTTFRLLGPRAGPGPLPVIFPWWGLLAFWGPSFPWRQRPGPASVVLETKHNNKFSYNPFSGNSCYLHC